MRIGRTLPPAAAPIPFKTILHALPSSFAVAEKGNRKFEEEISEHFRVKHCFLLSSGKAALTLILIALHRLYPSRDEVLIPAFTCFSVPAAIRRAGLRLKLCDLAASSLDFDKKQLQKILSADRKKKKILCVLPTHLFGCHADLAGIREITGSDIPVVEDAAQAMGEELESKKLGTFGDVGFYSLGRGKALSTLSGGVIVTSRDDLGEIIGTLVESLPDYSAANVVKMVVNALLTNLLQKPLYFWIPKNLPFLKLGETLYEVNFSSHKISSFQRKLAENWWERLEGHRAARIENIQSIVNELPDKLTRACQGKAGCSMIRLPIFSQTPEERNRLIGLSEQAGLGFMPAYPTPINEIEEIMGEFKGEQYPQAQDVCARLFTLPVHEFISGSDLQKIKNLLTFGTTSKDI